MKCFLQMQWGIRFSYYVAVTEALTPWSVEDMTSGEWPLSLFTCTLDSQNRVTVRCEYSEASEKPDLQDGFS